MTTKQTKTMSIATASITTAAVFLTALFSTSAAATAQDGTLTPEMLVDLRSAREVAFAPDGESLAYTVRVPRPEGDEPGGPYSELWVARLDSSRVRRFTSGKERVLHPAYSPDGKTLTFLVERQAIHEDVQLYGLRTRFGEARLMTRHPTPVDAYRWSPDGSRIVFLAVDPETEAEKVAAGTGHDWKVWDGHPKYHRLFLLKPRSGDSSRLFADDLDVVDMVWAPDGNTVFFQAAPTPRIDDEYMNTGIYTVSAEGGRPRRLTETPGKLGRMAVSPEGGRLAFVGAVSRNDPLAQSLFVVDSGGGEARNLTAGLEASVSDEIDLSWWDDRTVLLVAVRGARHALFLVDVEDGRRREVDWPRLIVHNVDFHRGSRRLAAISSFPSHPNELYVTAPDLRNPVRLSDNNPALREVRLGRQEVIEWKGADGWTLQGILTYPVGDGDGGGDGRPYPLVLQVHGGPEGVSLDGWTSSGNYPVQALAARGFLVLQPNYRGSQGRGVDFSKADHDDLGGKEYEDVLAGIDALVERGLADPRRVGTGGWSYGGYLSAWAATRYSERFRASVAAAGLYNWISFTGTTDIPYEMSLVHWNQWWFDNQELHWQRSPLAHLDSARTPTLIIHGEVDERVDLGQSLELYTALRIHGVPTQLVTYPREGHGLSERPHQLDFVRRILDWFEKYLAVPEVTGPGLPSH